MSVGESYSGIFQYEVVSFGIMARRTHTANYRVFRDLLRLVRRESGLTQTELARRLRRPQSFVSKYEIGDRCLDVIELRAVCRALRIPLQTFCRKLEARLSRR